MKTIRMHAISNLFVTNSMVRNQFTHMSNILILRIATRVAVATTIIITIILLLIVVMPILNKCYEADMIALVEAAPDSFQTASVSPCLVQN